MDDPDLKAHNLNNLKSGYPDCGSGRYSDKLTYEEWVNFNKAQRGHLNFLETVTIVCFLVLVTGLVMPWAAMILGGIYGAFRPLFFLRNRLVGFIPGVLCLFSLFGTSLYSCYKFYGYAEAMKDQVVTH